MPVPALNAHKAPWDLIPISIHRNVTASNKAAPQRKDIRLIKYFLGNTRTPLGRQDATGEMKSANGPTSRRERVLATEITLTCVVVARSAESMDAEGDNDNTIVPMLLMTISQVPSVTKRKDASIQNEGSRMRSRVVFAVGLSVLMRDLAGSSGRRSSTFEDCSVSVIETPGIGGGVLIINAPIR